jgi:hypothetical protein
MNRPLAYISSNPTCRPFAYDSRVWTLFLLVLLGLFLCSRPAFADSNATVTGLVTDSSGGAIAGVVVVFTNVNNGVSTTTETNREGIYRVPGLLPGVYRANLTKDGFSSIVKGDIDLHVQDEVSINFVLRAGSVFESITVEGGAPLVSAESPVVSTVVDRLFADNLPLSGRSFQTLIDLTPGVVLTPSSPSDSGQSSVNGQRADTNYWMVDGVSANTGIGANSVLGNGLGGGLPVFTAQGGTNSMVSLDAMREFRIETSTSSAEFGRSPGAQIFIVTRSGTNIFHGSLFDYFRNDALDANDWFARNRGLPKPEERQNDFGGTLSGPIAKGRTFFFFSYEGLRLRLPLSAISAVPDDATVEGGLNSRQTSASEMRPYLNAFPLPNGPEIFAPCDSVNDPACPSEGRKASGAAVFKASYSDHSALDAYSLRIDHTLARNLNVFSRYSYSPSYLQQREPLALSTVTPSAFTTQSVTLGATWAASQSLSNDFRFNYSRTSASSAFVLDHFGGAVPFSLSSTDPLSGPGSVLILETFNPQIALAQGKQERNRQEQFNLVEDTSIQTGRHSVRLGMDFRRLTPSFGPAPYLQQIFFLDQPSFAAGESFFSRIESHSHGTLSIKNLGLFVRDNWQILRRLTLNYGVRWDIDFAPSSLDGPPLVSLTGFNLRDLSQFDLAPPGTPAFRTQYANLAPRVGAAYQLGRSQQYQTVIRGGVGIFHDLETQEIGNSIGPSDYPFGATKFLLGSSFPLDSLSAVPPTISALGLADGRLSAFDPGLKVPYALEWNLAGEQAVGQEQTVSATYVGAAGRRLMQTALVFFPNPRFREADLVTNAARSSYQALQLQFNRRLNRGIQGIASYTWSHSIDDASAGSTFGNSANTLVLGSIAGANRGPSDFDIRHALSAGVTYNVSFGRHVALAKKFLDGWSIQSILQAHSAPPVNVYVPALSDLTQHNQLRPDHVSGIPLYLFGSAFPGGKAFNDAPGAVAGGCPDGSTSVGPFCPPPTDANGFPLRQGNLGRNALRAFGAAQWDFGIHRAFLLRESVTLQFRAEIFNLLNHPNFGAPSSLLTFSPPLLGFPQFGRSAEMLGRQLGGGNLKGGGLDPVYQFGGPRSMQFALRLVF